MSSITIILILFINYLHQTIANHQCELLNSIDLQFAAYTHSLILRVQPINSSEELETNLIIRKVRIREIMKTPKIRYHQITINDIIIIRIDKDLEEILDDSCWHLLRIPDIDLILFLNETNANEFDLRYPPVESTMRVRQNIDAVTNYDIYSPQVIIKTRMDKPILSNSYSLQCNARGNPLPRLNWSKNNRTLEYYPSVKQCKTSCRIYSIQNKYQSTLYFQSLTLNDSGIYVCHAENAINHTMTSVYIDIDYSRMNLTCASLNYCRHRGRCLYIDNQLKCLCDNHYFGDQCETNYDDIIQKQNNTILLFKSRFLAGCILFLVGFLFLVIVFISCVLSKTKRTPSKTEINRQQSPIRVATKESTTETDESPRKTETINNHLISSDGYLENYQPDVESGLIRPLNLRKDTPKLYTKCVSFHDRFLLPQA